MAAPTAPSAPSAPPSIGSEPVDLAATTTPHSLARSLLARRSEYVRPASVRVKIGSWNVAACPGTDKDLAAWFVDGGGLEEDMAALNFRVNAAVVNDSGARKDRDPMHLLGGDKIDLYILGLQEVVDVNLAKEYMTRAVYTDNTALEKWKAALEAAMPTGYQLVEARQMFSQLTLIYASPEIAPTIGNISTKDVGTGFGGWFANKGAVTTRFVLGETTRMVFVNCHLASGATAANLDRRCVDAAQILSRTQFDPVVFNGVEDDSGEQIGEEDFGFWFGDLNYRLDGLPGDDIRRLLTLHARGEYGADETVSKPPEGEGVIVMRGSDSDDEESVARTASTTTDSRDPSFDTTLSLPDPDDFPEDPSQDPTSLQATLDSLLPHDQLGRMMKQRKVFHDGWREGPISFLPTYKYDVGTLGLFDSSEKQRAPSWCDRILFRTRRDREEYERKDREEKEAKQKDDEMRSRGIDEDEDVLFTYEPSPAAVEYEAYDAYDENNDAEQADGTTTAKDASPGDDTITLDIYTSHQRVTSSDHKPITAIFTIKYDAVVPELKAAVHSQVARELDRAENEGRPAVTVIAEGGQGYDETAIDLGEIQFLECKSCSITIANTGGVPATFSFVEKPKVGEDDDAPVHAPEWLSTSFSGKDDNSDELLGSSVTLEPGETVFGIVTAHITSTSLLRGLNDGTVAVEDVLVLRVEDGRDHFIPVRGTWLPSSFGRSLDELIRVPDGGIRAFIKEWALTSTGGGSIPYDAEQKFSAPKELFKITTAMENLAERCVADEAMLDGAALPRDPGWPLDRSTWTAPAAVRESLERRLVTALDTDASLSTSLPLETPSAHKLEALSSILLLFLVSLTDGVIPRHLWVKLTTSLPAVLPATRDTKTSILDILSTAPNHNVAFVFLTTALARIASELSPPPSPSSPPPQNRRLPFRRATNPTPAAAEQETRRRRRAREKRFAEIVSPLVCRTADTPPDADNPVIKDKATREKARVVVDVCMRPDDDAWS